MILENQVAVVTGSSRGIGAATAKLLAKNGAKVAVNYVKAKEKGEAVVEDIRKAGGKAILVQADVVDPAQVKTLIEKTQKELGPVDILVNNANMHFPIEPFIKYSWEDFERKLVNEMKASFQTCQAVIPGMIEREYGCIVNVSSGLSRVPGPGFVAHSSAKSALDAFTKALAMELGQYGIRVNVVAPGLTVTDATSHQGEEAMKAVARRTPLMRVGEPEDIAGAVLFYCSDWSRFVTGTYLPVCGGIQMS